MEYGYSRDAVGFKIHVGDSLKFFQFQTSHGREIHHAMQTHFNDDKAHRDARRRECQHNAPMLGDGGGAAGDGGLEGGGGGGGLNQEVAARVAAEAKLQGELQTGKAFELSQRSSLFPCVLVRPFTPSPFTHQLNQEVAARAAAEAKLQSELQAVKEALRQSEVAREEVVEERARLA
ncbi:unnamed protein product [Closterium sp. Naga37s-1]|nr:unnamed protein product [Closterium sp. Naga37s-1]